MNLVKHVKAELARLEVETNAAKRALAALQPNMGHVEKWAAPAVAKATRKARATTGKRAPDSEITKARKRVASAKRFGKEPAAEDVRLVAVYTADTGPSHPQADAE
jgi:hypothetical protein